MLIDTHAHLNFSAYRDDLAEVAARTIAERVKVINVGSQRSTSERAVKLAEQYPQNFFAAIGLHPLHLFETEVDEAEASFRTKVEDFQSSIYRTMASSPRVVAIGEMGIDYFHIPAQVSKKEFEHKQKWTFLKGVQLAKDLDLPLILHCRGGKNDEAKAYRDLLSVLKEADYFRAVVHCFTSSWEIAQKFLHAGCLISFTGIITYPKTSQLAEVVKKTPLDKMMVETDAPYLAPQLVRGKRNEPRYVRYVADQVANIKKISYDEVEEQTGKNAMNFFKIT